MTIFSYDGNGNLTKKENAGILEPEVYSYTYNKLNQMTQFTDSNNQATDYTYYADGLRSSKQTGADKIQYYYSSDEVILETLNGNFSTRTIQGINEIARQDSTGSLYYYQYNGHGDVVNLLDGSGNVRNTYDFDEFGNEKVAVENGIYNPLRYTGEYYDIESGLYYLRARYYDPEIGRFISEDTNQGNIEDPLSLNLYTYCKNSPIVYYDPNGHEPILNDHLYENLSEKEIATVASIGIGFTPFDLAKDTADFIAGKDIFTGEKISRFVLAGCIIGPEATDQLLRNGKKVVNIVNKSGLDDGLGTYASQAGHHPMAKSAFEGISQYDFKQALTISQSKLTELGVKHATITGQQKVLYSQFAKSGKTLTLDAMRQIEIKAMTNSGVPFNYATNAVDKAIDALIKSGVTQPHVFHGQNNNY